MGILTALKIALSGILEFIALHWKLVLSVLLISVLLWETYQYGRSTADLEWSKMYNANASLLNAKITELETDSRIAVGKLKVDNADLAKRLESVLADKPKIVPRSSTGVALQCTDSVTGVPTQDLYLGKDFTQRWNALTNEGNK